MNEWGSHTISSASYASAYNSAISIVRTVYSGSIIIDIPGWGQETYTAAVALKCMVVDSVFRFRPILIH